jgi:sugar/nucleoside kinase (ribokinase family)
VSVFSQIDYLVIGHISRDIVEGDYAPGGTAVYSALAAQALGCRSAVITSVDATYDVKSLLTGVEVHCLPAEKSTVFENIMEGTGRKQTIFSVAETIGPNDVPLEWQRAPIVHLGPIAREIDPAVIRVFSNSLVGLTPQGWFRHWDDDGRVYSLEWSAASRIAPLASAVITSLEDLPNPEYLDKFRQHCQILVLTHGKRGCTVYSHDEERYFAAPSVSEVNSTGAGDIFATAFLIRLLQTSGNLWEAATFANEVASRSVGEASLGDKMSAIKAYYRSQV